MGNVGSSLLWLGTQAIVGALSGKRRPDKTRATDFTPTSLASPGAFVPLLIGRRRIGPVFTWAGDRAAYPVTVRVSSKGSKKKRKSTGEVNYTEAGWHVLCVGPAVRLHKIYQDGKVIFPADGVPINSTTTPSGSTLTTTVGDTFRIWWGEEDQDPNEFLGDASRVGVESRWPFTCSIEWVAKNLGPAPRWQLLEYDLETECQYGIEDPDSVVTTNATVAVPGTSSPAGSGNNPQSVPLVTGPGRYVDRPNLALRCVRDPTKEVGGIIREPTYSNLRVEIDGVEVLNLPDTVRVNASVAAPWVFTEVSPTYWMIEAHVDLDDDIAGSNLAFDVIGDTTPLGGVFGTEAHGTFNLVGDITAFTLEGIDCSGETPPGGQGPNGANVIGQILFSEFPHGLGLSTDGFDLESLADVGAALVTECLPTHIYAADGMDAQEALARIMADIGCVMFREPSTGLLTFKLIRKDDSPAAVPEELVTGRVPEVEVLHADRGASRLIYEFPDVDREFRQSTVTVDEDEVADRLSHHRARKVELPTVTDLATANTVAERRSQEEFGGAAKHKIKMNRGAIELYPGQAVEVEGIDQVLRVTEVQPDTNGTEVEVSLIPDFYGSEPSTFAAPAGGSSSSAGTPVAADLQFTFIEVPAYLLEGGPPEIVVLRVRAHDQISFAHQHLSPDGTTYQLTGTEFELCTGGELLEGIDVDDAWEIETGPTLELMGPPDDDVIDDLTSDEASWRLGRQCALIGEELFFVRKLTAVSGTTYRLDGLIRARYDTERAAHAIGDQVYLFRPDEVTSLSDAILTPGADLYVKSQPNASNGLLSLASVTAVMKTLVGKGIRPPRPVGLRVTAPVLGSASYRTGDDVTFVWASRSADPPITGAGMQPAGAAVGAGVLGSTAFEIRVYDSGDVLVRTVTRSVPEWTYENADLAADLAGETDFRVEVLEVNAGFYSEARELEVVVL